MQNNEKLTVKMPEQPVPSRMSVRIDTLLAVANLIITGCWVFFMDGGPADRFLIALFAFLAGIEVMVAIKSAGLRRTALRVLAKAKADREAEELEANDRF